MFLEGSLLAKRPNVIFVLADDLGWAELGCYGNRFNETPNLDRLAKGGMRFTNAYASAPVCSPYRAAFLTGQYPARVGILDYLRPNSENGLSPDHLTLPEMFRDAGYATGMIGKWHLSGYKYHGAENVVRPIDHGFDWNIGSEIKGVGNGANFWPYIFRTQPVRWLDLPDQKLGRKEYLTDRLNHEAVQFIERNKSKPFFLYLATTNIHHPFTPAKQFVGTSECGLYGDFIHELDWIVGEILVALDEQKVADNTLIIFTSDNGGMLHVTGQRAWRAGHRMNGDLLGFKFGAWEGGHRVPMIARWPGKIPTNTTSDCLFSQIDLVATLASVVGRSLKKGEAVDSMDQLASFTGSPKSPIRNTLIISPNSPEHLTVRHEQWVYIPRRDSGGFQGKNIGDHLLAGAAALPFTGNSNSDVVDGKFRTGAPPAQLYDLDKDPFQVNNVYSQHHEVVRELEIILHSYQKTIPSTKPLGWININQ